MSERSNILSRISEALRIAAPKPGSHDHADHAPAAPYPSPLRPHSADAGQWLPAVGPSQEDRLELFRAQSEELRTEFIVVGSEEELRERLRALAARENWQRVASHAGALTDPSVKALGLPCLRSDAPYLATEMERCDAGITECDALIAQTGSVVLSSRSGGGRGVSVLPPHHVVLARREQLLPDLPGAFAFMRHKYAPSYPSFISVITGPSRTGDIERILVLGAHGPKKLTVLLV